MALLGLLLLHFNAAAATPLQAGWVFLAQCDLWYLLDNNE